MRADDIDVRSKSVYALDVFELTMKDGRPTIRHQAAKGSRGALVAVYVAARDRRGALQVEILSRGRLGALLADRMPLDEARLAREAEGLATRRMVHRLLGGAPAAMA